MSVLFTADSLRHFYVQCFKGMGVTGQHARICADGLLHADLHGYPTHGVASLDRIYLRMLRDGEVSPDCDHTVVSSSGSTALIDGNNGLGFVTAHAAVEHAVELARATGVGAVAVRNSSHCGVMGFYTSVATSAGMIGLASTNLGAQGIIPPVGGRTPLLGTNVLAAAAPAAELPPFSLDMSTAVVAAGRIRQARDRGETVPPGWLADEAGRPVTDPNAYFDGTANLRFLGGAPATGGYKGYGLALLADVLCGVLSGAEVGPSVAGDDAPRSRVDTNIGHFFLALDVTRFRPAAEFGADLDDMLRTLCGSEPVSPDHPVSYPGLPDHQRAVDHLRTGIPVDEAIAGRLDEVAAELGIAPPPALPETGAA